MTGKIFCVLTLSLLTLNAQAFVDDDNLEQRLDVIAPLPRVDREDFSPRTVWQCTLTDLRGRRWYGEHPIKGKSCEVAYRKCVRNSARPKNCKYSYFHGTPEGVPFSD